MKRICSLLLVLLVLISVMPMTSATNEKVIVSESVTLIDYGKYNDDAIKNIVILNPNCEIQFTDYTLWYELFFGEFAWDCSLQECDFTLGEAVVHSPTFDGIMTRVEKRTTDHDCAYYNMYDSPSHTNEFHGCVYIDNTDGTTDLYCPICASVQAQNVAKMTAEDASDANTQNPIIINGLNWKLDMTNGVLYVNGKGEMTDYYDTAEKRPPWWNYRNYIKEVVIADGITRLGRMAFSGCVYLEKVTIPDSVEKISLLAFDKCENLRSVAIPCNVVYIGQYAFNRCTRLTSVTIPASVKELDQAFTGCTGLQEVIFEGAVQAIWMEAFRNCTNIETVRVTKLKDWFDTLFIRRMDDYFGPGFLPDEIPTYTSNPLYYGADLYVDTEKVTRLFIPQGVERIEEALFYNCGSINEVILPRYVSEIGLYSFACPNLTDAVIANPQCKIDPSAFSGVSPVIHALSGSTSEEFAKAYYKREFHPCVYLDNGDGTHDFFCTVCKIAKIEDEPHEHEGNRPCFCGYAVPCEHEYLSEIIQAPTCTEDGQLCITCTLCGYSSISPIAATGHSYAVNTTAPTCTAKGYTTYTCACGESYVSDYVDAMGHDWTPWNSDGVSKQRTCRTCGIVESELETLLFTDVDETDYFCAPVLWAVGKGITNGISATEFAPNDSCTRAQIVTFLWRSQGAPLPKTTENPFTDVSEQAYYYHAVLWAVENGITNGLSANEFAPDAICTRAQAVTFLYRTCGSVSTSENQFIDVAPTDYFYEPVLWAVENGITMGIGGGRFAPQSTCTRAQIVTFLYRALS